MCAQSVMRDDPQHAGPRSWIAITREHVEAWRRENHWSRETVVQLIVEAHEAQGFDKATGIRFEPGTTDPYNRMKVNAERVYRWLDDSSNKNLLSANMMPSILAGMPMERRQALAWALLSPLDLGAVENGAAEDEGDGLHTVVLHFRSVVGSSSDAQVALADMLDGIDPGEAEAAQEKLGRSLSAVRRALGAVSSMIKKRKGEGKQR